MTETTSTLNPQQQAAQDSESTLICMMAGPGSGKTHTLIKRAQRLVASAIDPSMMVIITFTNEAANELKKRSDLDFEYCGTLHGFMLRILQEHGAKVGLQPPLAVIGEEQRDELLAEVMKECGYRGTKTLLQKSLDMGWLELKALGTPEANYQGFTKADTTALAFYRRLIKNSMLDYDSILHMGLAVAKLLEPWDLKALYLFVDEYQDSSPLDALIYEALPVTDRFFIGDADQSIYAFRGAAVENIVSLTELEAAEVLMLEDNYRSGRVICTSAQNLIEHNADRPQKVTRSVTGFEGEVLYHHYPTERDELVALARQINALPDANEVAVLVRTNYLVERYFREGLQGLSVQVPRVQREANPADWKKTQLLLSLLCNPENDNLAYRWLLETKPKSAADKVKLGAMQAFQSINQSWLKMHTPEPVEVSEILARNNIANESIMRVERARENLPAEAGMPELVAAVRHEPARAAKGDGVTISTIHGAKGREWDYVFLPAFEQGIIPSLSKKATIEEERRLAFVAITRARRRLTVSHADVRREAYKFGERSMTPSQFIDEMQG